MLQKAQLPLIITSILAFKLVTNRWWEIAVDLEDHLTFWPQEPGARSSRVLSTTAFLLIGFSNWKLCPPACLPTNIYECVLPNSSHLIFKCLLKIVFWLLNYLPITNSFSCWDIGYHILGTLFTHRLPPAPGTLLPVHPAARLWRAMFLSWSVSHGCPPALVSFSLLVLFIFIGPFDPLLILWPWWLVPDLPDTLSW